MQFSPRHALGLALLGSLALANTAGAGRHGHADRSRPARSAGSGQGLTTRTLARVSPARPSLAYRPDARLATRPAAPAAKGCRIRFAGAAGAVTGSMHMLEAGGKRLLIDCGMKQGKDRYKSRLSGPGR